MIVTKKILILIVIAMLALGVMALANTAGYYKQATQGATCQQASLSVNSMIGIEQGYVATATSYNASFCGAPCPICNCTTGPEISQRLINGKYTQYDSLSINQGILISELTVKSNAQNINVTITITQPSNASGSLLSNYSSYYIFYNNNASNNLLGTGNFSSAPQALTFLVNLLPTSSYYVGAVDVVLDTYDTHWGEFVKPGDYYIRTTFLISPQNTF
ncbi:hypothetical protein [Athalassotoga saccharophila]|uniref:hypothetical protein n=1 Tax=Athalassotoga saccharophila TaxID=1441386 RepID=UPI001379E48D|nr:hypothetical protein [Athalassotoga saccharophila]BBJ28974.1 hypothetical protein ATHSA_1899 [Athalassotoga saccharophila]